MSHKNGIVKNIIIDDKIKNNIYDSFAWKKKGDEITDYKNEKLGICFLRYDSKKEMINKTLQINKLINIELY